MVKTKFDVLKLGQYGIVAEPMKIDSKSTSGFSSEVEEDIEVQKIEVTYKVVTSTIIVHFHVRSYDLKLMIFKEMSVSILQNKRFISSLDRNS